MKFKFTKISTLVLASALLLSACDDGNKVTHKSAEEILVITQKYDGKIVHQPSRNRGKDDGWYLVKNGKRSWIVNGSWLAKNGYKENEIIEISSDEFNAIPECSNPLY
jgi:hypothetical protein